MYCCICKKKIGFSEYYENLDKYRFSEEEGTICSQCSDYKKAILDFPRADGDYDHTAYRYFKEKLEKDLAPKVKAEVDSWVNPVAEYAEREEREREQTRIKMAAIMEKAAQIPVTTGDLKETYTVIAPIFTQLTNRRGGMGFFGSSFDHLLPKYSERLTKMYQQGLISDMGTASGMITDSLRIFTDSTGENNFEAAFQIAVMELQEKAARIGANAVICMRQDINIDTSANNVNSFYLNMYGTAIRTASAANEEEELPQKAAAVQMPEKPEEANPGQIIYSMDLPDL